tara:strand:- start:6968 stop:7117 length:150 start_codon:yes stop_codon:yes gene_type:complete
MVLPPVKSIPGLSPGAMIKNTIPGINNMAEIRKHHPLFAAIFNLYLLRI